MDYIWRKLRSESVLRTPYYGVSRDRLKHPQGHEVDYYVIEHPRHAAGVVAVNDEGQVVLVQQWRHPVQKLMWSVPAGGMEEGETAEAAARRELMEETGHSASSVELLISFHPNPGTANQTFHVFIARGVSATGKSKPGEIHAVSWFSVEQLREMLKRNELLDGLSLVGVMGYLAQQESRG